MEQTIFYRLAGHALSLKDKQLLAKNLRRLMEENKFNQSTLAEKLKIDRKTINRIMNPKPNFSPDFKTLEILAEAFGREIHQLFEI